jgi:pimeloyl-ACP methyl ester carboxylesterase
MAERMIEANGVELCTERLGDPIDPTILLIMGSGASMVWWEDDFCQMLADGGRSVIRYDHRDTGRSVTYEPGRPGYTPSIWSTTPPACWTHTRFPLRTSSGCRWVARSHNCWRSTVPIGCGRWS